MIKKLAKYHIQYFDLDGNILSDECLPDSDALQKFRMCCLLGIDVHFERAKDIRLVCAGHVLYQFRDIRSIVNQRNLL